MPATSTSSAPLPDVSRRDVSVNALRPATDQTAAWSFIAAALLAGFYLATSLYIASHRLLWIDEVLTALTTRLPGWAAIWQAFTHGADGLPPTYFMVERVFDNLLRHTDFGLRVPSALAVTIGLLLTFDCARRLTDGLHGLVALSVLTCSFLPYYGHEARSYGLFFMLAALSLWIWTHHNSERWPWASGFGATLFLAVLVHYYAVLILVPYAVWEMTTGKPWRTPSRKLMLGIAGTLCAVAVLWTPIQAGRHIYPANNWTRPTPELLRAIFPELFPEGLFLLALLAIWIAFAATKDRVVPVLPMLSAERLGWFFLLIPLAGYLLGQISHVFVLRYFIATLPGVAVAFSCCVWRHLGNLRRVSVGILLILATWGVAKQLSATLHPDSGYYSPIRQILRVEDPLRQDGKRFFVLFNQARYMEALHYSTHPEQYVLLASMDRGNQQEMMTLARYYPMQLWTFDDLKKHASDAAFIAPSPDDLDILRHAGFAVDQRFSRPANVAYPH
ncbi:MAG: glycosyltransferase family 39 protein [Candidatus Korobacteraceae bacterium]